MKRRILDDVPILINPLEVSDEELADMLAGKEDTDAILDAVKELTKVVGVLSERVNKHMTAGKFWR